MLDFQMMHGGVVDKAQVAVAITEIVIANMYGKQGLERQRPLIATEEEDRWQIKGSFNLDKAMEGQGPITLWICKRNARIVEIKNPYIWRLVPEVKEIIERELRKQREE